MTTGTPPLALLLDVDGPIASPVTRDVRPGIIADLIGLLRGGIPVIFNTGRSDTFITEQIMAPMIEAGMPDDVVVHAICEKGAVWFDFTTQGAGPIHVDESLAVPAAYADDIRRLVADSYSSHMFFDETKHAMISVEQRVDVGNADYKHVQARFDADALDLMNRHDMGVLMLQTHLPDSDERIDYRVEPTIISTDIESVRMGKDLGASRAVELLAARGITPHAWRTVGDSRSDYAMADWLFHHQHAVKHVDVRPAEGVPQKPYEILTAGDLGLGEDVIHDDAGAAFLSAWLDAVLTS